MEIEIVDETENPELYDAIRAGNISEVWELINSERYAIDHPITRDGASPLDVALLTGNDNMVEAILEMGSKPWNMYAGLSTIESATKLGFKSIIRILCHRFDLLNETRPDTGFSPLQIAAYYRQTKSVETLCELGADVNYAMNDGLTALHIVFTAIEPYRAESIIKILLRSGAMIDARGPGGITALHLACTKGFLRITQLLLDNGALVNQLSDDGKTPLCVACENGNEELACLLLEYGALVNFDGQSESPLRIASERGLGNVNIMEMLVNNGASVDQLYNNGTSPLIQATTLGQKRVVQFLLEKGASVNAVGEDKSTPLHVATIRAHTSIVHLLLKYGANVNLFDGKCCSPLYYACYEGYTDILEVMLEYGADPRQVFSDDNITNLLNLAAINNHVPVIQLLNARNIFNGCDKNEALLWSARAGSLPAMKTLLEIGADINYEDKGNFSYTALHYASESGNDNCVGYLVSRGVDVETVDARGKTALIIAVESGKTFAAQVLLEYGANVHAADAEGNSSLIYACEKAFTCMIQLLLEYEAGIHEMCIHKDKTLLHCLYQQYKESDLLLETFIYHAIKIDCLKELKPQPMETQSGSSPDNLSGEDYVAYCLRNFYFDEDTLLTEEIDEGCGSFVFHCRNDVRRLAKPNMDVMYAKILSRDPETLSRPEVVGLLSPVHLPSWRSLEREYPKYGRLIRVTLQMNQKRKALISSSLGFFNLLRVPIPEMPALLICSYLSNYDLQNISSFV